MDVNNSLVHIEMEDLQYKIQGAAEFCPCISSWVLNNIR